MLDLDGLDYPELIALGRVFGESRFPEKEWDEDVWLSPYVIQMHCDVMSAQRKYLTDRNDLSKLKNLDRFLTWWPDPETNRLESIFVRRVAEKAVLADYVLPGGPSRVKELLRPYVLTDADAERIISRIVAWHGN